MTYRTALSCWPIVVILMCGTAASEDAPKDADAARIAFNNVCRTCHSLKPGDDRLGPSLHGVVGRKAGSLTDFGYSAAMKQADLVWDKATLDRFLAAPDQVVPGNRMKPFGGVTSADQRALIIALLEASK